MAPWNLLGLLGALQECCDGFAMDLDPSPASWALNEASNPIRLGHRTWTAWRLQIQKVGGAAGALERCAACRLVSLLARQSRSRAIQAWCTRQQEDNTAELLGRPLLSLSWSKRGGGGYDGRCKTDA